MKSGATSPGPAFSSQRSSPPSIHPKAATSRSVRPSPFRSAAWTSATRPRPSTRVDPSKLPIPVRRNHRIEPTGSLAGLSCPGAATTTPFRPSASKSVTANLPGWGTGRNLEDDEAGLGAFDWSDAEAPPAGFFESPDDGRPPYTWW
jgi:hypothetical protein